MERESLLTVLIVLLGGAALQLFGAWSWGSAPGGDAARGERRAWLRLWCPAVPGLMVAAWLCGWALSQPDPVTDRLDPWTLLGVCTPLALLFVRAVVRAGWSLVREPAECGVSTVGLIRPHLVICPFLARRLDERELRAALEHERAHARHRDPLRIWIAQLITDLQWPWPSARRRMDDWLAALELARDEEARVRGVDGADLAAAVLASVRYGRSRVSARSSLISASLGFAGLIGARSALRERVARLLEPLPPVQADTMAAGGMERAEWLLMSALCSALLLGLFFGASLIQPLLALSG